MDENKTERVYVTNGDVIAYAKNGKGCSLCAQPGVHIRVLRDSNGNTTRQPEMCPRTWQRFLKRFPHPLKQDVEKKQFFYTP